MDITKTTTHVSLCAGYGGIDLGLKRAIPTLRTIAFSEIEAFACANLVAKMEAGLLDPAPIWTDLKTFPWAEFRDRVGILSGGYPCQPFSAAGKRLGAEDPRHLWPHISAGIALMRPSVCFFENVEGHISLGLPDVIEDLAGLGYRTTWGLFSASEVGAPHQRKRVFILAHNNNNKGLERYWRSIAINAEKRRKVSDGYAWPSCPTEQQFWWEPPRVMDDPTSLRSRETPNGKRQKASRIDASSEAHLAIAESKQGSPADYGRKSRAACQQEKGEFRRGDCGALRNSDRDTQPPLGRDADGPAGGLGYAELCVTCDNRTDELRLLGNGVVPATAERAFRVLSNELTLK